MGFQGMSKEQSPAIVVRSVAEGLYRSNGEYHLDYSSSQLLKASKAWAMLIDDAGQVTWEYMLPEEVPKKYALTEVAKFSRNYLMDYPVFVWEHDERLVVVGYPKFSLAKYQHILPSNWVSSLPSRIFSLIIGNIALALVLSLLIGSKLIKSIRPLTQAIQGLAQDKEVFVEPKGILASWQIVSIMLLTY